MAVSGNIKCVVLRLSSLMAEASSEDEWSEVREAFQPSTIKGLCEQGDVQLEEILLFCLYCWKPLSYFDKILFELCERKLIWKIGGAYASCHACCKLKCQVEFLCYYERTISAVDWERESGSSIYQAHIKCLKCERPLTFLEKQACVFHLEAFQLVKDTLRGTCSMCRVF